MGNKRKEFSKIYDQYINKIYRFIFLKVNSEEIAQDLCSETFLRGWASFNSEEKIDNCQAFLYTIARNLVTDFYREKGRTQFISTEDIDITDSGQGVEDKIDIKIDIDQIKAVLASLNEDYQNVVIWHYLDDLPITEVARMMDKTEPATRVTLHRALQAIKGELNKNQTA